MSKGTIITFYSYKGGVGRTFALANVAALLSLWGYKTLCVDWDLEAPGLHLYFKPWLKQTNKNPRGLTELVQTYADGDKPRWRDYITEVIVPGASQPLLLMQAGSLDTSYVQRMQALDWNLFYDKHRLGDFIEELRDSWKDELDFVLIDSRTGITDTASICTVQLPDILALVLTANDQSLTGSLDMLERIQANRARFPFDRAKLLIMPIVSRFERRVEYTLADLWLKRFTENFSVLYSDWAHKDIAPIDLLNHLRIPHIPIWSFGEEVPVITKGTSDSEDIGYSLETLAALMAQNLQATDILVQSRDKYIQTAKKAVNQQLTQAEQLKTGARIFISYAFADESFATELKKHLTILRRVDRRITWSSNQIIPGQSPDTDMRHLLEEANIILLLISSDYLASDFLYETVMQQALKRHEAGEAVVIPILLRPTDLSTFPLAQLPSLPTNVRPISKSQNLDEAWLDVVRGIRKIINDLSERIS